MEPEDRAAITAPSWSNRTIPFGWLLDSGRPEWVFYLIAIFMAVALFTVIVPAAVVLIVLAMMMLPLPAFLLDLLFSFNIALSLVILLAVIYAMRPLELASFPTIVLAATLLRLALNVASTRVVLIKGYDARGIVWYTNYDSRKGRELAAHPQAALQFHWVELERVVRIEGRVEKVSDAESDAYFHSRPLDSRIGAWASPQSRVIASRAVLVANAAKYGAQFLLHPPRPPHWGGYRLVPDRFEFWQGRPSRLHDRLRYRLDPGGAWRRERLAP